MTSPARSINLFVSTLLAIAVLAGISSGISFDNAFGSAGKFVTTFSSTGQPTSNGTTIYIQPSGRIVVLGQHQQQGGEGRLNGFVVAGLTPEGVLDNSFGVGGKIFNWSFISSRTLVDSVMLGDGSILVLTHFVQTPSTNYPSLLKYTPGGQNDASFLANLELNGIQTTPVLVAAGVDDKVYVIVRQATAYFVIRLNADGSRDTSFAPDGFRALNLNRIREPSLRGLAEIEGGKLLITGGNFEPSFGSYGSFILRYDSDTNLDRSFGNQGVVHFGYAGHGNISVQTIKMQPDGKILVGGYYTVIGSRAILIRLTSRGRYDSTFGIGGVVLTVFNDWNGVLGIAVAPNGSLVVAGHCGAKAVPLNERLFVARYTANGVNEGSLVTNIITNRDALALDVAIQPDGKFVIAATTVNEALTARQLAAARFTP